MYHPIAGGSYIEVDGLRCHIPPVPLKHKIMNHDLPQKEQKWRRTPLPENWEEMRAEEIEREEKLIAEFGSIKKLEDLLDSNKIKFEPRFDWENDICHAFRKQEWERRLNGFWLYIDGVPTYLTGKNYYYLNWCEIDVGYPEYYDTSRLNFYFREYCFQDPNCLGYVLIGARGFGKTTEEVAVILEEMTRTPAARHAALQSKTEDDAKDVIFKEKMVPMYNLLPDFFKPISNHGSNPENKLSFFRPSIKGKGAKNVRYATGEELKNDIYPVNSQDVALDGQTLGIVFQDEIGKTVKANVDERTRVNKFTVYRNYRKRGMMISTTTVEEMDKGGANCQKVWNKSNQLEKNANGMTKTGQYRRFVSCIDVTVLFRDEFGKVDKVKAKAWHDANIAAIQDDPTELASYYRKNPQTVEQAFYVPNDQCVFNALVLNERLAEISAKPNLTSRWDLTWENGVKFSKVIPVRNDVSGKLELSQMPNEADTNSVEFVCFDEDGVAQYKPLSDDKFAVGVDPVDHGGEDYTGKKSSPVALAKRKFDYSIDQISDFEKARKEKYQFKTNRYFGMYDKRTLEPVEFYEFVMMLCWWLGCQAHIEDQKPGLKWHMIRNGMKAFVMNRPTETYTKEAKGTQAATRATELGTPSSTPLIQQYTGLLATLIHYYGHTLDFKALINSFLKFNPKETTKYDHAVSAGFTELACLARTVAPPKPVDLADLFQMYDNTGTTSIPI